MNIERLSLRRLTTPIRLVGIELMHHSALVRAVMAIRQEKGGWIPLARAVHRTSRRWGWKGVVQRSMQTTHKTNSTIPHERVTASLAEMAVRFAPPATDTAKHRGDGSDILLITHDLTMSGAPRLLVEIATLLKQCGHFVVVVTPTDGAYRQPLVDLGIPVICDELVLSGSDEFFDLAKNFDIVLGSTVLCWRDLARLSGHTRTYLYSHESQIVSDYFIQLPGFSDAIRSVTGVIAGSERAAAHLRPFRRDLVVVPGYGAEGFASQGYEVPVVGRKIVVTLMGSKELRKGQDIAVEALDLLNKGKNTPPVSLRLYGRDLDPDFVRRLKKRAKTLPNVMIGPDLPHDAYLAALKEADIVLSAARDDTLPLVSLDALALGRVLVCTSETGTSDFLDDGTSGFVAANATAQAVAEALVRAIGRMSDWPSIGCCAHKVFDTNFTKKAFHNRILAALELCPAQATIAD